MCNKPIYVFACVGHAAITQSTHETKVGTSHCKATIKHSIPTEKLPVAGGGGYNRGKAQKRKPIDVNQNAKLTSCACDISKLNFHTPAHEPP